MPTTQERVYSTLSQAYIQQKINTQENKPLSITRHQKLTKAVIVTQRTKCADQGVYFAVTLCSSFSTTHHTKGHMRTGNLSAIFTCTSQSLAIPSFHCYMCCTKVLNV